MNWLERITGICPDGGNGTAEMVLLALALTVALTFATRYLVRERRAH